MTAASSAPFAAAGVTQISWHPRAFIYKEFLTHQECDHLLKLAKDKLKKSMVADNESGEFKQSSVRTSSGIFLNKHQDDVVASIEARIAAWTFFPEENGENIQVLRYEHGQQYEAHFDYFHDKVNRELGGHRLVTVLMYLSNVKRGGETVFPRSEAKYAQPKDDSWSECAQKGFAVKPNKGDALLFFNIHLDATTDASSPHGSCPVIEGEKWTATKWIHVRSFEKPARRLNGNCVDNDEHCAAWAAAGGCGKSTISMLVRCRKSCEVC